MGQYELFSVINIMRIQIEIKSKSENKNSAVS